jgi:hypothetical protein
MLGGQLKVPGVAEESRELRGQQTKQPLCREGLTLLRCIEQRVQSRVIVDPQPTAAAMQQLAVAFHQFDSRQRGSQLPGALKLLMRQHDESLRLELN